MLARRPLAARLVRWATDLPALRARARRPLAVRLRLHAAAGARNRPGGGRHRRGALRDRPRFLGPGRRREWAWRLLYVGRIDERKGADVAVSALANLPGEATLTVLGDGDDEHRADLDRQIAAAGLESRVRLEPGRPREGLVACCDDHDAVLFPVRWDEPWGLVPLEAMARGRPVVATGTGGSAEYLRDGENALLAPGRRPGGRGGGGAAGGRRGPASGCARPGCARPASTEPRFNERVAEEVEAACVRAGPRGAPTSPPGRAS